MRPHRLSKKSMKKMEETSSRREFAINDHLLSDEEFKEKYSTDYENGLFGETADLLLKKCGPNRLDPPKKKNRWVVFSTNVFGGFSALLWIGALLSIFGYAVAYYNSGASEMEQLYLGGVLVLVVVITGVFGYYQESTNLSIVEGFNKMMPRIARVIRGGELFEISSESLVVGDLIEVVTGDFIPADIRLVDTKLMKVDNSSLTGECEPQLRTPICSDKNPLETVNLAFFGTNVVEGVGRGIVIATGNRTLMGQIAKIMSNLGTKETTIQKELRYFIRYITTLAVCFGVIFFVLALCLGYNIFEGFVFFIAIVVANVPEGMIVTMTASLTLTAKRMAKKKCLVKNLEAIETLGSTNVICSDKTGTLTQNCMTVSHMYYDLKIENVLVDRYVPVLNESFKTLCRVCILCSNAHYDPGDMKLSPANRKIIGDASESAVMKCMEGLVGHVAEERLKNPKICEIPFNSRNKYHVTVHKRGGQYVVFMKGAPERIINHCTSIALGGKDESISKYRSDIFKAIMVMGNMGERVIGFADLELPEAKFPPGYEFNTEKVNFPLDSLRFVGLISMIDPPKAGVLDAVKKCKMAGIKVIMVTGDHPVTAVAIAKKVGIISADKISRYDIAIKKNISVSALNEFDKRSCTACVISGTDLVTLSASDMDDLLSSNDEIVFARTSPQQKLLIVEAFQRSQNVVAVTGDGVNDSPALKKADIGVSMGISGSDVSKEAADIILLDDNFATIVTGIEEGRIIFENLKKSVGYVLTSNVPELVPFLMFVIVSIPPALSCIAIILIDVGTDLWPGLSLAYEKAEADIMCRKPRNLKKDKLVNIRLILFTYLQIGLIQACAGFTAYFFTMANYGFLVDRVIGLRNEWRNKFINDLVDSFGQEWSFDERQILEKKCYSAYFMAIVITQVADVIICKNRRLSIKQQKMNNWVLNFGIVFEMCLALFVIYCPYVNSALQFEPVNAICYLPALPYAVLIIVLDELRRYFIRKYPGGWMDRETYF